MRHLLLVPANLTYSMHLMVLPDGDLQQLGERRGQLEESPRGAGIDPCHQNMDTRCPYFDDVMLRATPGTAQALFPVP